MHRGCRGQRVRMKMGEEEEIHSAICAELH